MKIDVQARQFSLTAPLRAAVQNQIERLADAIGAKVTRVSVRLFDVNGLRGGPDKGCMVHAHFADGVTIVASDVGEDLYRSVPAAFEKLLLRRRRLGEQRRIARRRLPDRPMPMPA
ncbi:MAG: HPF/RaiA family ribosome-associated protein [Steroidobacteraceae bacterium]